jgi:hypothetical protein
VRRFLLAIAAKIEHSIFHGEKAPGDERPESQKTYQRLTVPLLLRGTATALTVLLPCEVFASFRIGVCLSFEPAQELCELTKADPP